jgi:regulatory protein
MNEQQAIDAAMALLARRDRSVAEVRRHLAKRGADKATVDAAIEQLVACGYLDDAKLAREFVVERSSRDGWGQERIARRLEELGIDSADIEAAFADHDHEAELDAALVVLRRRTRPPVDDRDRARSLGLLQRRGFDHEVAVAAIGRFEREG